MTLKEIVNKILITLRIKSGFKWELSESEKKKLAVATKKYFSPCLNLINEFAKGGKYKVQLTYRESDSNANLTRDYPFSILPSNLKGLSFEVTAKEGFNVGGVKFKDSYGLDQVLHLTQANKKYIVSKDSVFDFENNFPRLPLILKGKLKHFKSDNDEGQSAFRRLIVQVRNPEMLYPTDILEFGTNHMKFDNENWDWQKSSIGLPFVSTKGMFADLCIKGRHFHFYALEPISSYVIDSTEELAKDDFSRISNSIRTCFAFLSGKFYRDEAIYLSSSEETFKSIQNFEIQTELQTIDTDNQVINPHFFFEGFQTRPKPIQDIWAKYHKMFPADVFSFLCEKVLDSTELLRSIELIINAGSIPDPVQKGALYSVALETLTEYYKNTSEDAFKPIKDKDVSKEFIEGLTSELGKIKEKLSEGDYNILEKKIANINSPTNREKLTKPFELLSIELTEEDSKILDQRNKYLHGDRPKSADTEPELLKIANHLHSLAAKLVLKSVGYSGHFIHLPSWYIVKNKDNVRHINPEELNRIHAKIDNRDFSTKEEFEKARQVLKNYQEFLTFAIEIDKLIAII